MHVLIVSQYFWPESFRINDLAAGLAEKGHKVTVLTGLPNYPGGKLFNGYSFTGPCREDYQGITVLRVPLFPRGNSRGWRLALNYLSFLLFGSIFGPWVCREKYDLIFVAQYSPVTLAIPAIVLKKLYNLPVMLWVQDLWPESLSATGAVSSKLILNGVGKLVNYIYRNCDKILVQSKSFVSSIEKTGTKPEKILYFPNWAEELYCCLPATEQPPRKLPNGFIVMFAGNIGAAQDFNTILAAAEQMKSYGDIHWVILGEGREKPWVEREIKRRALDNQVHLLGRFPVEDMPLFFAYADAMLVILKKEEIFAMTIPSKVQSYLACGKPIVAVLEGAGSKVIEEAQAGICVTPEDVTGLVGAILQIYNLPSEQRSAMGARGATYYKENFDRDMLIAQLEVWMDKELKEELS